MRSIKEIREKTGLSRPTFGAKYGLPVRTLENWELTSSNGRHAPEYVVRLLDYKVESDLKTIPMSYVVKSVSQSGQVNILAYFNSQQEAKEFIKSRSDSDNLRVSFQRLKWDNEKGTYNADTDISNDCENQDVTDMVMGRDK